MIFERAATGGCRSCCRGSEDSQAAAPDGGIKNWRESGLPLNSL